MQVSTAAAAASYLTRALPASAASDKAPIAINPPLSTFAYSDVRLLDGPMKRQFDELHARFLNLDDDRYGFRADSQQDQSPGQGICRDARSQG
jgi:hypothetical protein